MGWLKEVLKKIFGVGGEALGSAAGIKGKTARKIADTRRIRADSYLVMTQELKKLIGMMDKGEVFEQARDMNVFIHDKLIDVRKKMLRVADPKAEKILIYTARTGLIDRYKLLRKALKKTNVTENKEAMQLLRQLVGQISLIVKMISLEITQLET